MGLKGMAVIHAFIYSLGNYVQSAQTSGQRMECCVHGTPRVAGTMGAATLASGRSRPDWREGSGLGQTGSKKNRDWSEEGSGGHIPRTGG